RNREPAVGDRGRRTALEAPHRPTATRTRRPPRRGSIHPFTDRTSGRSGGRDPADIRDRLATVARRVRQPRSREADLIYEAVHINLGVGDKTGESAATGTRTSTRK